MKSNFLGSKKAIYGQTNAFCMDAGFLLYFDPSRSEGKSNILFYISDGAPVIKSVYSKDEVDNTWQQLVLVKSGTSWRFYLDGDLVASESFNINQITNIIWNGYKSFIGFPWSDCSNEFSNLNGQIDDVRRYNKAFSDAEVRELYNREKP